MIYGRGWGAYTKRVRRHPNCIELKSHPLPELKCNTRAIPLGLGAPVSFIIISSLKGFLNMASAKRNAFRKHEEAIKNPDDEIEVVVECDKSKVECICPKCDKKHIMNFHWIGRGTPRKYCHNCRENM